MPEGNDTLVSARAADQSGQAQLVNFRGKLAINPAKRMPIFDNGTSQAFEARDPRGEIQIAIICDPKMIMRFSQINSYDSLVDTALFHLVDHGIVFWPPENAERYVLVYSCVCNEAIGSDYGVSKAQWRGSEVMASFVIPTVRALEEMHGRNFIHGAIRPSNVYFSTTKPEAPIVLGDCLSVQPGGTQPALYEPIERALAHPLARGPGKPAHDIYSFGVTLLMLLRGKEAFEGMGDEEITYLKIEKGSYGALVGHERIHSSFLALLRGVLHDDENQRWGIEEINTWLEGGRLSAAQIKSRKKANRPFHFMGKSYHHVTSLAFDLHKSPEELHASVKDDSLGQWLEKSLGDKAILERYYYAINHYEKKAKDNKDFLLTFVTIALAPAYPVFYKGLRFCPEGIGALLASYIFQEKDISVFKEILKANIALDALKHNKTPSISPSAVIPFIKLLEVARMDATHQRWGSGIEKCTYLLCRDAICLSPKFKGHIVRSQKDIMRCFEAQSKKGDAISLFLDNHIASFLFLIDPVAIDRAVYEIASEERSDQIYGNLMCLGNMQQTLGQPYPAIASVFVESLEDVYKRIHNKNLREKIQGTVEKAAKSGNLHAMLAAIDNPNVNAKDKKAFRIVCQEYAALEHEKKVLNQQMSNKKMFGLKKGRDTAAVFAWIIAMIVTVLFVAGFLGGRALL